MRRCSHNQLATSSGRRHTRISEALSRGLRHTEEKCTRASPRSIQWRFVLFVADTSRATSLVGFTTHIYERVFYNANITQMDHTPRFKDDVKFMKAAPPFCECECFGEHGMPTVSRMLNMIHFSEYASKFDKAGNPLHLAVHARRYARYGLPCVFRRLR